jgi:hypothetical protein
VSTAGRSYVLRTTHNVVLAHFDPSAIAVDANVRFPPSADISDVSQNASMKGRLLIGVVAAVVLGAGAFGVWRVSQLPLRPARRAMARVEAIKAIDSRVRFSGDWVYVRNDHAFGQFSMLDADVKCEVGDEVPVLQQGAALSRVAETCRSTLHPQ